jgi:uncharacterized protein YutE (UPF0331/DUF86 family)
VEEKLAYISHQVADLRQLAAQVSAEEFIAHPWLVRGAKYALQTAVEAMIDLAYHLAAKSFAYAPADARDAFTFLGRRGVFGDRTPTFLEMVRFRNAIVHGYERIDDRRVYEIMATRLGDFDHFIEAIRAFCQPPEDSGKMG